MSRTCSEPVLLDVYIRSVFYIRKSNLLLEVYHLIQSTYDKTKSFFSSQGIGKRKETVAVKTFQFTLKSFISKEAATMANANHQNIVKFFGLETIIGTNNKALIMELCEENMQDIIDRNPNGLSPSETMRFSQNLISAIQHLRSENIIHRDVKPANVLQSQHNGHTIYKLADFGAARFLKPNETYGSLYGTFEYMHPDIFSKFYARSLNIMSPTQSFRDYHELWSLGVTIFEVASGQLPFRPKNGRRDVQIMFHMIADKGNGCISAREVDGEVEWSMELPENLDKSVKDIITPLLAGLLQVFAFFTFF